MPVADEFTRMLGLDKPAALPARGGKAQMGLYTDDGVYPTSTLGGAYDGASRMSRELMTWTEMIRSADAEILPDKQQADARNRAMMRNDSYVLGAASIFKDNIIGGQYMLNAKPVSPVLRDVDTAGGRGVRFDDTWEQEFQEEVEAKFGLYAESADCWCDAGRKHTFTDQMRLAVGIWGLSAGEYLETVEWLTDGRTRPYSTAFNAIELDRLSNPPGVLPQDGVRGGVKRGIFGDPVGYYIRDSYPADIYTWQLADWTYIPIRKPFGRMQVIHLRDAQRPDQTRGMSAMVSALKELRMGKRHRDLVLQSAVLNATYAATVESDLDPAEVYKQLGVGDPDPAAFMNNFLGAYLAAVAQYTNNGRNTVLDGVRVPHLFPGTKLQLRNAATPGGVGTSYERSLMRYTAAGLGVSYEEFASDYENTNYSSIQAASAKMWRGMQAKKKTFADRLATMKYKLWFEEAVSRGDIASLPQGAPSFYLPMVGDAYTGSEWVGASRGQIDQLKETQAATLRLTGDSPISTLEMECARLGLDWRQVIKQRARETRMAHDAGLQSVADKTNMMNATQGTPKDKSVVGKNNDDSGGDDGD